MVRDNGDGSITYWNDDGTEHTVDYITHPSPGFGLMEIIVVMCIAFVVTLILFFICLYAL